jgi:hypothetical protein
VRRKVALEYLAQVSALGYVVFGNQNGHGHDSNVSGLIRHLSQPAEITLLDLKGLDNVASHNSSRGKR